MTAEKETVKCKKCGYEFLVATKDPFPKCGNTTNEITIELETEAVCVGVSTEIQTQKEQTKERKIVNWPVKIILLIFLFGAPILGLILANIPGAIVGFILDVIAWYLEKFAEKRFIEKTIERDHYH